jgi:hypothetical protein
MTNTTTVDCIGKNTSVNNGTYPTRKSPIIAKGNAGREITTKTKRTPHHPYWRMYYHVLTARITGEPPVFRGKPRFCEKNTVK